MKYCIRFHHPVTHKIISRWQRERPQPVLKVPVNTHRGLFVEELEDRSRPVFSIAEYECQVVYHTAAGEPIYDYWRVR